MSNQKKLARHSNIQKPRKLQTGDAARSLNGQTISKRRKKRTQAIKHLTPKKNHACQRKGSCGMQGWPGPQKLLRHCDVCLLFLAEKIVTQTGFSINL